jgi:hypothetical protein
VLDASDWQAGLAAIRRWAPFLGLTIFAALLTPLHIDGVLFGFRTMGDPYILSTISEWQSPNFQALWHLELWLLIGIGGALLAGVRLAPARAALILVLLHLSLQHARFFVMLALLTPLIVAAPLAATLSGRAATRNAAAIDRMMQTLVAPARLGIILVVFAFLASASAVASFAKPVRPPEWVAPRAALDAVRRQGIEGHVFNHYNYGGFLIFSGVPVFVDGRTPIYGDEFLRDTFSAVRLEKPGRLPEILEEWDIAWTLLPVNAAAVAYLDGLTNWRRLYADEHVVVHVRAARK